MPKPVFVQERDEESVSLLQDSPKLPAEETSVKIGVSERGSNNQGQNAVQKSMSMKMVAFFGLVIVQGAHVLFFRLSQIGGKYQYNTASAIAVTEAIKLAMSGGFYYSEGERKLPSWSLTMSYTFLALSYAINNQLAMYILTAMGTGMLTVGKSASPVLTALCMWTLFSDERFVQLQCILFVIITMGLLALFSPTGDSGSSTLALAWLVLSTFVTTINGVFNARVLQKGECSMHMQNMLLYSQGFVFNLVLYISGVNATGKGMQDQGFFDGYNNVWVIFVLISQSFLGIAISAVYKYGDVIIKCLAVGVQAAILLLLDCLLFGYEFNLQSIMGAGIVLVATYAYFTEALPAAARKKEEEKDKPQSRSTMLLRLTVGCTMSAILGLTGCYVIASYIQSSSAK
ncbi:hypothetical protein AAMO2058_000405900 [Amorphochlora amoebiformis]